MRPILLAVWILGTTACGSRAEKAEDTAQMPECGFTTPARFITVEEYETGPGQDGEQVMDHWRLTFEDTTFSWSFSNTVETGTYSCDGTQLTGEASWGPIVGTYDGPSQSLIWDGIDYEWDHSG